MNWSEYQEQAAEFFSSLGLNTKIEYELKGARGIHILDVYASGNFNGISFNWIIECKAWKSNIPKEKVMALSAIVQDVGADRGFLLSETGFQSGAIRAARSTNITLTSLEDLSFTTERFEVDSLIGKKNWEIQKAKGRLLEIKRISEAHEYSVERTLLFGELGVIEMLFEDALEGRFPVAYPTKGIEFSTLMQLIRYADGYIQRANSWSIGNKNS